MAKNLSGDLSVASANRLADGVVVFLDDAGEWTTRLERAAVARDKRAGEILLERAQAEAFTVVDPFLVAVTEDDDGAHRAALACAKRSAPRASPSTPSPPMRCVMPDTHFYRLRRLRPHAGRRARRAVPRPGAPPARGRADRGAVQAAAADQRALPAAPRLHAADRHPLRHAVVAAAAQAGRHRAQVRPRLRPFHDAPEPAAQLDQARGRARRAGRPGRGRHARHADLAATASATSPPTTSPAPPLDEIEDPRIWCEIVRQWSTLHPEFSFLPRKFKIAITGSPNDRAAVRVHDIGLRLWRNEAGEVGFEVIVGGGLGRTPMIGKTLREFLPQATSCWPISRRRCASTTATAGATTSTRRASRSWCTRSAPRRCARRSRPSMPRSRTAR